MLDNQSPLVGAIELSQKSELTGSPVAKPELSPKISKALDLVVEFYPELENSAIAMLDSVPMIQQLNLAESFHLADQKALILESLQNDFYNKTLDLTRVQMKTLISADEVKQAMSDGREKARNEVDQDLAIFQRDLHRWVSQNVKSL